MKTENKRDLGELIAVSIMIIGIFMIGLSYVYWQGYSDGEKNIDKTTEANLKMNLDICHSELYEWVDSALLCSKSLAGLKDLVTGGAYSRQFR